MPDHILIGSGYLPASLWQQRHARRRALRNSTQVVRTLLGSNQNVPLCKINL
jgi:hypothetical protein